MTKIRNKYDAFEYKAERIKDEETKEISFDEEDLAQLELESEEEEERLFY